MTRPATTRLPEGERFDVRAVEAKQLSDRENALEVVFAVFGNEDEGGDIIERGAFAKTLRERVPRRLVPFLDSHQWTAEHTHGTLVEAEETAEGVRGVVELSTAERTQALKQKIAEGHLSRFSFGFDAVRETFERMSDPERFVRRLLEVKLLEVSVVPLAMNESTRLVAVKSVVPFRDLPLAARGRAWDAAAAEGRVRRWAGGADREEVNFTRYRRAFLWYDRSAPEQFGSYRLPIADVVDGSLVAVPRAIFAAAAALEGARGGVNVPDADVPRLRSHLERYYAKMRREFSDEGLVAPWNRNARERALAHVKALELGRDDLTQLARDLENLAAGPPTEAPTESRERTAALRARAATVRSLLIRAP